MYVVADKEAPMVSHVTMHVAAIAALPPQLPMALLLVAQHVPCLGADVVEVSLDMHLYPAPSPQRVYICNYIYTHICIYIYICIHI